MKFMLMIYSNAASWDALTDVERQALGDSHVSIGTELIDAGTYVDGAGLADETLSRTVRVRDGETLATDGPFVESKEHLAGFYVVDCLDRQEAIGIAARLPDAAINFVEVRPVDSDAPCLPGS